MERATVESRGNLLPIHILKPHWGRYGAETCNKRTLTTPSLVSFRKSCLLKSAVEWSGAGGATYRLTLWNLNNKLSDRQAAFAEMEFKKLMLARGLVDLYYCCGLVNVTACPTAPCEIKTGSFCVFGISWSSSIILGVWLIQFHCIWFLHLYFIIVWEFDLNFRSSIVSFPRKQGNT